MTTTLVLPRRVGERPATRPVNPHQQLDQIAPRAMQAELWRRMAALNGVKTGRSHVSLPDSRALHLDPHRATGPVDAYYAGTEFAHLHGEPDGSLHVTLPVDVVAEAVDKGWAEPHPMVRMGMLPPTHVMLYGPRDAAELDTIWHLVETSYAYACGRLT